MENEDLYVGDVRNYYNLKHILSSTNNRPGLKVCSSSFLMVKLNVENVELEPLEEEERADYDTM